MKRLASREGGQAILEMTVYLRLRRFKQKLFMS